MRFNVEGDLLFTAGKDAVVNLWYVETGERVGNYEGHTGAVYALDATRDSRFLLTGSADNTVRLWEVLTGKCLAVLPTKGPCHGVAWAEGEREFAVASNRFSANEAALSIYSFDPAAPEALSTAAPRLVYVEREAPPSNPTCVGWLPLNEGVLVAYEDGSLSAIDPLKGEARGSWAAHAEAITSLSFNESKTLLVTSSKDKTAVLWDVKEMEERGRFVADVPVNAARLSPLREHVILGGGQEARDVTTTAAGAGKFETRFFDVVMGRELGRVKGHFGPIHSLDFSPDGWGFASGAEDGYVRLHRLDAEYLLLGEEDNLDDPQLTTALEDGTYEALLQEDKEESSKGQARG